MLKCFKKCEIISGKKEDMVKNFGMKGRKECVVLVKNSEIGNWRREGERVNLVEKWYELIMERLKLNVIFLYSILFSLEYLFFNWFEYEFIKNMWLKFRIL